MTENTAKQTKLVNEFMESGKSQRVWCREKGIKRGTLRYWLERVDELSEGTEIKFAEIEIGGDSDDSI